MEASLESPEHRVVLLSRDWREFGIGAVVVTAESGIYGGAAVTIVTADFGRAADARGRRFLAATLSCKFTRAR